MSASRAAARAQRAADAGPRGKGHRGASGSAAGPEQGRSPVGDSPTDQLLWLQSVAGNRAVAAAVQAETAGLAVQRAGKRERVANSRFDALMADYPGITSSMTFEQLDIWRQWLTSYSHNEDVIETLERREKQYRTSRDYSPDLPIVESDWLRRQDQIRGRLTPLAEEATRVPLDPRKILGPDVGVVPQWNVGPETRFRQWVTEQFASKPLVAVLTDRREIYSALEAKRDPGVMTRRPHVNLVWGGGYRLDHTAGTVTFADLLKIPEYRDTYHEQVANGPEVRALRDGLSSLESHIDEMMSRHKELSDKNAGAEYSGESLAGVKKKIRGGVRHVSESLGAPSPIELAIAEARAGSHPDDLDAQAELLRLKAKAGNYPKLGDSRDDPTGIWYQPNKELDAAKRTFKEGQVEVATAILRQAEQSAAVATTRFAGYEERVMGGAGIAVKWLQRAKTAGKIASAFTGVTGVVRAAATSAGYTFVQEGAQEASTSFLDPSHKADLGRVTRMAAIDGIAALFGGVTQGAFTRALTARFGNTLMTTWQLSGPTAEKVLSLAGATTASFYNVPAKIVLDRIIDGKAFPKSLAEVADMVVQEAATSAAMDAVGSIIQSSGVKAETAAEPGKAASTEPGGPTAAEPGKAASTEPGGPTAAEPGRAPPTAARPASAEEIMAAALASGGTTGKAPAAPAGRAPATSGQAGYTAQVSPEVARLAAELHPIHAEWSGLRTVEARAMRLVRAIEPSLEQTGVNPIKGIVPAEINGARFDFGTWTIRVDRRLFDKDDLSPAEFANAAGLIRHELEHAVDWFRMARQAAGAQPGTSARTLARQLAMPHEVVLGAVRANEGKRAAEPMTPDLARATAEKYESVYGRKSIRRDEILENVEAGWAAIERAVKNLRRAEADRDTSLLMHEVAIRELEDARLKNEEWELKYQSLPEEIPALRAGDELAQAIREHGIQSRLSRARVAEQEAYNRYSPLLQAAAGLRKAAGETLGLADRRALDRAIKQWMEAVNHVKALEREIAALRARAVQP